MSIVEKIGMIASVAMPLFNIPLIRKIFKRKSSNDISLTWLLGVWICIVLMAPAALKSTDIVFKVFGIINLVLFSFVVITVMKFRRKN